MYSTIRTEKIKDRKKATEAIEHNLRLRSQSNIDRSRTMWNRCLFDGLNIDRTCFALNFVYLLLFLYCLEAVFFFLLFVFILLLFIIFNAQEV